MIYIFPVLNHFSLQPDPPRQRKKYTSHRVTLITQVGTLYKARHDTIWLFFRPIELQNGDTACLV